MQRINAQPTFTDLTVAELGGPRAREFFDTCQRQIPFDQLAASVADIFKDDTPEGGRPHWPIPVMLKVLFIQKCFGLSDPMAEEMLRDRISFRRFVGLSFDDATPDHSTISTFRKRLRDHGHASTPPSSRRRWAASGKMARPPPTPAPARLSNTVAPTTATAPTSPRTSMAS